MTNELENTTCDWTIDRLKEHWTIVQLKEHLQGAVDLEFWTIPFYMSAMYSIKDRSLPAYQMLRTVVNQEMLHLQCAANIANAYGLSPTIHNPPYKGKNIPHLKFPKREVKEYKGGYTAEIGPLDLKHINAMCLIEHPEENHELQELKSHLKKFSEIDPAKHQKHLNKDIGEYQSIGAFYNALRVGALLHQDLIQGGVKQVDYFSAFYRNMPNMKITESGAAGFHQVNLLIDLITDQGEGDTDHKYHNNEDKILSASQNTADNTKPKDDPDEGEIPSAFQNTADDTKPKDDHFAKFTQIREDVCKKGQKFPDTYIVEKPGKCTTEQEQLKQEQLEENLIKKFTDLRTCLQKLFNGENPEDFLPVMATVGGAIKNCWLNGVTPKYSKSISSESKIYSWAMEDQ